MTWTEVKKINSDLTKSLDERIDEKANSINSNPRIPLNNMLIPGIGYGTIPTPKYLGSSFDVTNFPDNVYVSLLEINMPCIVNYIKINDWLGYGDSYPKGFFEEHIRIVVNNEVLDESIRVRQGTYTITRYYGKDIIPDNVAIKNLSKTGRYDNSTSYGISFPGLGYLVCEDFKLQVMITGERHGSPERITVIDYGISPILL